MKTIDIPLRLRVARERAEMTQRVAARLAGLDKGSISSWETGKRIDSLTVTNLLKLMKIYRVHPAHFFSDAWFEVCGWR